MNCKDFKQNLPKYLDGELDSDKMKELDIHRDSCAQCLLLYQNVTRSLLLLKAKKEIEEQPFYYTRLKQKMLNQQEKKSFLHNLLFKKSLQLTAYFTSIVIAVFIEIGRAHV